MRVGLLLSGLALMFPASAPAQPETILYSATVSQAETLVRSKPSEQPEAYPTNSLRAGAVVQVVEERGDGWLTIKPPEKSFSWINKRFVHQPTTNNPTHVVTVGANVKVPVIIGSEVKKDGRPTNEGALLLRGAIVVSIGPALTDAEGSWLPIEPPPGEYRYIRREAVTRAAGAVQTAQTGPSPFNAARPETGTPGQPNFKEPSLSIPTTPPQGVGQNTVAERSRLEALFNQAVQADRAGQYTDAIGLYTKVGTEGVVVHQDLAMRALNRSYELRNASRGQTVQGQPVRQPATLPDNQSQFTPAVPGTTAPRPTGGYPFATGLGRLTNSTYTEQGRRTFLMLNRRGEPIAYVLPGTGVDLGAYLDREIELSGVAVYRGDLKTNLMIADRVQVGR
jgi:hypothetical protein